MVGHSALGHLRALLAHLGLGALALRLGLGHLGFLLGHVGLPSAFVRLGTVLTGHALAALLELAFTSLELPLAARPRQHEEQQRQQDQHHDDEHDDQSG